MILAQRHKLTRQAERLVVAIKPAHVLIAILLFAAVRSAWLYSEAGLPFLPLSYDDFAKVLFSRLERWIHAVWLPGPLLLNRALMSVFPQNWLHVPALVNWVAYMVMLVMLYGLGRDLFDSQPAGLVTAAIAATMRWPLWLSLSGLTESLQNMLVIGATWGVLRWIRFGSEHALIWATGAMGAATTVHYHTWAIGGVFVCMIGSHAKAIRRLSLRSALAMAGPFIFPIAWLVYQQAAFGDPLQFFHVHQVNSQVKIGATEALAAVGYFPGLLFQLSPAIAILAGVGLLWAFAGGRWRALVPVVVIWLTTLTVLIGLALAGAPPTNLPSRWVMLNLLLAIPIAGGLLSAALRAGVIQRLTALILLAAVTVPQLSGTSTYPKNVDPRAIRAGLTLASLWSTGFLTSDENVLLEKRLWDHLPIEVLSGRPEQVLTDRSSRYLLPHEVIHGLDNDLNPSIFDNAAATLDDYLLSHHIAMALAHSDNARAQLNRRFVQVDLWGDYGVFVPLSDVEAYQTTRQ